MRVLQVNLIKLIPLFECLLIGLIPVVTTLIVLGAFRPRSSRQLREFVKAQGPLQFCFPAFSFDAWARQATAGGTGTGYFFINPSVRLPVDFELAESLVFALLIVHFLLLLAAIWKSPQFAAGRGSAWTVVCAMMSWVLCLCLTLWR